MSRRYEVGTARTTEIGVLPSEDAAADEVLTDVEIELGHRALIIGDPYASAYALTGTPAELRRFLAVAATYVDGLEPQ